MNIRMERNAGNDLEMRVGYAPLLRGGYTLSLRERETINPYLRRGFILESLGIVSVIYAACKILDNIFNGGSTSSDSYEESPNDDDHGMSGGGGDGCGGCGCGGH